MLTKLKWPRPTSLDRYVLTEVLGPFGGGLAFAVFVSLMFQLLRLADFFIIHGVPGLTLLKMAGFMALSFAPIALPLAFLIAVLIGFGRLSADSELVAMKANGVSLVRMSLPIIALSVAVVVLSFLMNTSWVPWSQRTLKGLLIKVGNTKAVTAIKEGTFTTGFFDILIFADRVDTKNGQLTHVFIYDEREPKSPMTIIAKNGEIVPVKTSSELGAAIALDLHDGSIHSNDIGSETYQVGRFGTHELYLQNNDSGGGTVIKPGMLSHHELLQKIAENPPNTFFGAEFRGEYWRRIAVAITPVLFVFFGIGFGTVRTRAVKAGAALVWFVTIITYYGIQTFATYTVQTGILTPWFAMELPNIVIGVCGYFAFRKSMW